MDRGKVGRGDLEQYGIEGGTADVELWESYRRAGTRDAVGPAPGHAAR